MVAGPCCQECEYSLNDFYKTCEILFSRRIACPCRITPRLASHDALRYSQPPHAPIRTSPSALNPLPTLLLAAFLALSAPAFALSDAPLRVLSSYIDSNANIPDRTAAILSNGPDPVPEMASALRNLEACGADCVIMPCNTAHYFLPRLQAMTEIPFLSILTAAAEACKAQFPGKTVGILATKGTLSAQLYQNALGEAGVPYLIPETEEQDALMRVIYDGVKAGKGPDAYRADLLTVVEHMMTRGAGVFLLGCTELPLAAEAVGLTVPVVDPTAELAKAAIRFCGFRVRAK